MPCLGSAIVNMVYVVSLKPSLNSDIPVNVLQYRRETVTLTKTKQTPGEDLHLSSQLILVTHRFVIISHRQLAYNDTQHIRHTNHTNSFVSKGMFILSVHLQNVSLCNFAFVNCVKSVNRDLE